LALVLAEVVRRLLVAHEDGFERASPKLLLDHDDTVVEVDGCGEFVKAVGASAARPL
tara:strand:+ start:266 stop:436 length:171 start_codon:yes stop_codon:yes gene_type:complete